MNILFICKYNRFRSKVAEALFNKYNQNREIVVKSAGLRIDFSNPFVAESVINVLAEKKAKVADEKSSLINENTIEWADKVIVVANNVDPEIFRGKDVDVWKITDIDQSDIEGIRVRINDIESRIKDFVNRL